MAYIYIYIIAYAMIGYRILVRFFFVLQFIYIYRMSQTVVFWMVLVQLEHDMFFEQLPTSKGPPKEIRVL